MNRKSLKGMTQVTYLRLFADRGKKASLDVVDLPDDSCS